MSVAFVSASSQYLSNAAPAIVALPLSIGFWVYPTIVTAGSYLAWWGMANPSSDNIYLIVGQSGGAAADITIGTDDGGGGGITEALGPLAVVNNWYYVIARIISITNRRLSVLSPDGSVSHVQDTTSRAFPTSPNTTIGNLKRSTLNNYANARIAEFWSTNVDIQSDGAQLADVTIRQLAFRGPFSMPSITNSIVEYRALRQTLANDRFGDTYYGVGGARQIWAANGSPLLAPHPPLLSSYVRPGQRKLIVPI